MPDDQNHRDLPVAELSSAALAYLGDSVLELCVREHLLRAGLSTAAHLNAASRDYVTASAQAQAMQRLLPYLTEQEAAVFRRGRNNVHANIPKKATMAEYRAATGMECLFAYLYLTKNQTRINELFALAYLDGEA
jgi:ribonuclease-3 family protein